MFGDFHGLGDDLHDRTRCDDIGDDGDGHFDLACDRHLLLRDHLDGARDGGLDNAAERQSLDWRPAELRSKSNLSIRLLHWLVDDGEHAALITVLPVALADRTRVLRRTPIGPLDKVAESVGAKLVTAALRLDVHTRSTAPQRAIAKQQKRGRTGNPLELKCAFVATVRSEPIVNTHD